MPDRSAHPESCEFALVDGHFCKPGKCRQPGYGRAVYHPTGFVSTAAEALFAPIAAKVLRP
jgi:hypothetical protein